MEFSYEINDWATGVVQSIEKDKLPQGALSEAKNTQFWNVGVGQAAIGTRAGLRRVCRFIDSSTSPHYDYVHLTPYSYSVSENAVPNTTLVAIEKAGRLRFKDQGDTWDGSHYYPTGLTQAFTGPVTSIDSTVMNNRLFILAGAERRSLLGKTFVPFGLRPPAPAINVPKPLLPLFETALPSDTYSVYVTAYEPKTGTESEPLFLGDIQTNGNAIVLSVAAAELTSDLWGGSGSAADKYWRIYMMRQSTQSQPYLVQNIYDNDSGLLITSDGNISGLLATTSAVMSVTTVMTAEEIADLVIPMPAFGSNLPLDSSAVYLATFGRRLIGASRRRLFWSKLDQPDSFPEGNSETIDSGLGDEITGIMPLSDEVLIVWTKTATFGLMGNDPQTWTLKPIDLTVGCVGKQSAVQFDGKIGWWSPQHGPVILDGGQIQKIGKELIGQQQLTDLVNFNVQTIAGGWDPQSDTVVWSVPGMGDVANSILLPFNVRLNRWCANEWDPVSVPVMATVEDNAGKPRLFVMDSGYTLFCFDQNSQTDGAGGGTLSGTFVAGASQISTITGSGFFYEAVGGSRDTLFNQRVTIVDANGDVVARRIIASNTASVLTLDRAVEVTNGATYGYYISAPLVTFNTGWLDNDMPFFRKRHDRLYVDMKMSGISAPVVGRFFINNGVESVVDFTITAGQGAATTLDVTWDVSVLLTTPFVKVRKNLWKNGHNCQIKFQQAQPVTMVLSKLALTGRVLHERYYS